MFGWKSIPGFSKYEASNTGAIRFKSTKRVLKGWKGSKWIKVHLQGDNGSSHGHRVHRLVKMTFEPVENASRMKVRHVDGNTHNNNLSNLKWSTSQEVMQIASKMGKLRRENTVQVSMKHLCTNEILKFSSHQECRSYCTEKLGLTVPQSLRTKPTKMSPITNSTYQFYWTDESLYETIVVNVDRYEQWKMFENWETKNRQYFVSNYGRIKTRYGRSNMELLNKLHINNGYYRIGCSSHSGSYVHRLVASKFVPNPCQYEFIDHIDGVATNNHASNLRWVKDALENAQNPTAQAKYKQRSIQTPVIQLDMHTGDVIATYDTAVDAQKMFGARSSDILAVCRGKRRSVRGFKWKFATNEEVSKYFLYIYIYLIYIVYSV